jgi:hypothetical protein
MAAAEAGGLVKLVKRARVRVGNFWCTIAENIGGCFQSFLAPDGLLMSAYLLYRPYDLGLVMYNNKLVSVTVSDGPAEINLAVWNQQSDDPSCADFNPFR